MMDVSPPLYGKKRYCGQTAIADGYKNNNET